MPSTKKKEPDLSIVLPVYNEEENVRLQYENIVSNVEPLKLNFEMIFVNDGSSDGSPDILRELAKKDRRVKVINFRRNFGQTAAMMAGIDYSTGEVVVFMDSDLQNDAEDIRRLLEKIHEGYDVVSGWRKNRKDKLISRKIPSRIANWIISRVGGVPLHDLGCSLKAYRGEVLRQVKLYGEMHRFIPVHASWVGARITEIPVNHHERKFGQSKYGIKRTFKVLLDLVTVKFMGSYSTKPIYVFGGMGFLLFVFGLLTGASTLVMRFTLHFSVMKNPLLLLTILLTIMLMILSVLFISLGILAELLIRVYHESQAMPAYRVRDTVNLGRS